MARRFRFKLEAVQKLRKQARDAQRRQLAIALQSLRQKEAMILEYEEQLGETMSSTRTAQSADQLEMALIRSHQFYRTRLHQRIAQAVVELEESRNDLRREQAKLGEATQRLRAIEKLREKQWARHAVHVAREEQAELDEAGAQGYIRNQMATNREEAMLR